MGDLERYRARRDFTATAEPRGTRTGSPDGPHFVIQHHLATADHYDFRLEIGGVLVSWAVPKGPSTDPRVRRMAVRTEDHPLDYETFEGRIAGEYGRGVVQVWDRGTFDNASHDGERAIDLEAGLERGHLSVVLHGEKLIGGWSLVRLRRQKRETWLLIKRSGQGADARRRPTSTQARSVLTGRTMAQIARETVDASS